MVDLKSVKNEVMVESAKSQGRYRLLLKVGVSLIAVLVAGYSAGTILRTSSASGGKTVVYHAVAATQQRYAIKAQDHPVDSTVDRGEKEEQKTPSRDAGLTQEQDLSRTGAEAIDIPAPLAVPIEKASTVAVPKTPAIEAGSTNDRILADMETEPASKIDLQEFHSIEIGPIFSKHELKEATGILHDNGLDPEKISEMETKKLIRLFEGSYTRDQAQNRLKEIQKVVDSAFVLPEKGKYSIYVATYHDRDKAIEKSKQLEKYNIKVIPVSAEIKMNCTKLVVEKVEQPTISTVQDQMSKMGLSANILISG